MAAGKDVDENTQNRSGPVSSMVINHEESPGGSRPSRPPVIFNPDFFVEKLRHENPDIFLELVLSNITRLIDLPGTEFAQLLGEEGPKIPTGGNGGFFRSFNFLKRKEKGVVFGTPLTEICIAQIYQLIEYLSKNLHVEGLFRVPGNSVRQQTLKELLNSGVDVDLESGDFHPNDVATLLKTFLGELPEPLLTQRHFHAHLKIADLTLFDELGNKTALPNKERQIEALQLLFLLLPQANRSLLKLLLDLLYHTARQQDKNKMSAFNLALMFAPHVVWPRNMTACDLKDNLKKLNSSMAFLIKHSQKLFRAPVYLREYARMHFTGSKALQTKDDLELFAASRSPAQRTVLPLKRSAPPQEQCQSPAQQYTEEALKDLFRHVNHSMPDSAKKKKLVRQLVKQTTSGTPTNDRLQVPTTASKKHPRSRSFGGFIKRKARGEQPTAERRLRQISPDIDSKSGRKAGKENVILQGVNSPLNGHMLGKGGLIVKNPDFAFKDRVRKVSKQSSPSVTRMCFSPAQEISL
ncbi:rho GTPase-activating protein 19-like isoform X2 [Pseudochaenichthys georgianus]|uniref:rho GTPase-activating protein 19-like isoform X2 n=1 Tax=Pseudochaenichthys georgianus TaxID=52239 RepID=UPI00146A50B1|nr:rho GTPase-activating protein 19-like isoform X1 [Pseudochaenichthys georgianus]